MDQSLNVHEVGNPPNAADESVSLVVAFIQSLCLVAGDRLQ